jgi:phage terminase large subunit-like protein
VYPRLSPSSGEGIALRSSLEQVIVAGKSIDNIGYVLADRTCNLPPEGWARVAVTAYREFQADRIVAERNFGGDMVRGVLHTVDCLGPPRIED